MNNMDGYNDWATSYDTVVNKTRDLEGAALRESLAGFSFSRVLELGCGTGKNTAWLGEQGREVLAMDFSIEMVNKAKEKIYLPKVHFIQKDITTDWNLPASSYDLITASLVLEHIENLDHIFAEAVKVLHDKGLFYLGELHPFKQYEGSKARFDQDGKTIVLDCYTHHISDYFEAATKHGFTCIRLKEYFDEDVKGLPRLLVLLFKKSPVL